MASPGADRASDQGIHLLTRACSGDAVHRRPAGPARRHARRWASTGHRLVACLPGRQRPDESGQSLLEVAIALGVLSVVMLPLAMVFYWGATSSAQTRENGDAIAIANGFLSQAQSVTYADLGFYEDQFGTPPQTVPGYAGQPGVDLGQAPPAPAAVAAQIPVTSTPQKVGSIVYSERTYVVWANASGGDSYAYKQVYAVVSWTENGRNVSVTQNILVYPGGLGKYTGPEDNT